MNNLYDLLGKNVLFFDGGTGTTLQTQGLKPGELPETWNIAYPEKIIDLHYNYFAAGCNIVKTNTFGANILKFPAQLKQIVESALQNAHQARLKAETDDKNKTQNHFIALDIGPVGKLLEPLGDLSFNKAVEIFSQTIEFALCCQVKPDLILIETMNDCYEAKAAVVAAKETMAKNNTTLPLFVTTVYDESGKSLTGSDITTMTTILEGLGVDALGMNCSLGPEQMTHLLPELVRNTDLPIIVNPNAGLPRSDNGLTVYDVSPMEFAQTVASFVDMGASIVGGCCGTTPEHIGLLVKACKDKKYSCPKKKDFTRFSSGTKTVCLQERTVLVGERINPTGKKRFKQALRENDLAYIIQEGVLQEEKGVHALDVNVGLPEIDEVTMLENVVKELQSVTTLPLQIDSSNTIAMEKAMRIYNGKPLINSVNGKQESMQTVFPLVKKYGGVVVALTLDEDGIPETVEGRINIVEKIYSTAAKYGISKKDIIIDPLAMAISSDPKSALVTLRTLKTVQKKHNGKTILGVSNISFGLPQRDLITSTFFTMAMQCGLNVAIMNPNSFEMMKAYTCFSALTGHDENCSGYISFAQNHQENIVAAKTETSATPSKVKTADELQNAVMRGLKTEAAQITQKLLCQEEAVCIINNHLIPALDVVGKGFEAKTIFLPQLLMSAEAAKSAFSVIKENLSATGKSEQTKGKIVIATVKGDIHDIGKNIVKVLLENYGFTVIDLGKDVNPEIIVKAVQENNVQLVGLSALMTTTVPSMQATIKLLRKDVPNCKICVGGAVLTQEYADMIGADFYAKDALETVKYAQKILTAKT